MGAPGDFLALMQGNGAIDKEDAPEPTAAQLPGAKGIATVRWMSRTPRALPEKSTTGVRPISEASVLPLATTPTPTPKAPASPLTLDVDATSKDAGPEPDAKETAPEVTYARLTSPALKTPAASTLSETVPLPDAPVAQSVRTIPAAAPQSSPETTAPASLAQTAAIIPARNTGAQVANPPLPSRTRIAMVPETRPETTAPLTSAPIAQTAAIIPAPTTGAQAANPPLPASTPIAMLPETRPETTAPITSAPIAQTATIIPAPTTGAQVANPPLPSSTPIAMAPETRPETSTPATASAPSTPATHAPLPSTPTTPASALTTVDPRSPVTASRPTREPLATTVKLPAQTTQPAGNCGHAH